MQQVWQFLKFNTVWQDSWTARLMLVSEGSVKVSLRNTSAITITSTGTDTSIISPTDFSSTRLTRQSSSRSHTRSDLPTLYFFCRYWSQINSASSIESQWFSIRTPQSLSETYWPACMRNAAFENVSITEWFSHLSPLSCLDQNTNLGNSIWCHALRNSAYFLPCQILKCWHW